MTKKEVLSKLNSFDDDSDVVFVSEFRELLSLDNEGVDISYIVEVNNGHKTVIALME